MRKILRNLALVLAIACFIPACNTSTSTDPSSTGGLSNPTGASVQCSAYTQKNERCKNKTNNTNGRCYLHQ